MKQNKFIIITPCYNVEPYVQQNIYVNKFQSYKNALYVYIDDNSKDTTYSTLKNLTQDDPRFLILQSTEGGSQAKAYMYGIEYLEKNNLIDDQDIIVEVDGDDWLSSVFVLDYLNDVYQRDDIWMTYGQYQIYPTGKIGGHYRQEINQSISDSNLHRKYAFPYSHLKTYKYWLLNKVNRKDLIDNKTGEYYSAAWDHVLCLPMVEMAGKEHTYMCDDILYVLNRSEDLNNESKSRLDHQKGIEAAVRSLVPYPKILNMDVTNKPFWHQHFVRSGGDDKFLFDFDLDSNSTVFDIGSFDGDYFRMLHKKYSCNIHAFEPVTSFYQTSLNSLPSKILVNNYALGSNSDDFTIHLAGNSSSAFSGTGEKVLCKKTSFISYVERNNINEIDLLKVNCEGGEYELLEAIIESNWLSKIRNIIIQFHILPGIPVERRQAIVDRIGLTHSTTFSFPFIWEGWKRL